MKNVFEGIYLYFLFADDLSKKQKVTAITKAVSADPIDIVTLRQLSISRGGLLNHELRRKAWPKLLNVNVFKIAKKPCKYIDFLLYIATCIILFVIRF